MTQAQRIAIASPATSLMVYQTDAPAGFYFYNGSGWSQLSTSEIGWKLDGNNGTSPAVNFVGTTDNQPLCFRINNIAAGWISPDGIALGHQAGLNNPMPGNTIIGTDAFMSNATGIYNVAIGTNALQDNTDGGGILLLGPLHSLIPLQGI